MYSNDTTQIRSGLVNYLGALIVASKYEPQAARHDVAAMLVEEAIKLAKDENDNYDMFVLKPILKANAFILDNRISEIDKDLDILPEEICKELQKKKKTYQTINKSLKQIIDAIQ